MNERGSSTLDTIFLRDLQVQAIIGIFDWERAAAQKVMIDVEMATDVARAAASDSIRDAIDYKRVSRRLIAFTESSKFALVETLAESLARIIVTEFEVPFVRLSVSKPGAIEGSRDVGVVIERTSKHYDSGDSSP